MQRKLNEGKEDILWDLAFRLRKVEQIRKEKKKEEEANKKGVSPVIFDVKGVAIQSIGARALPVALPPPIQDNSAKAFFRFFFSSNDVNILNSHFVNNAGVMLM